jgi:hypothetical protein
VFIGAGFFPLTPMLLHRPPFPSSPELRGCRLPCADPRSKGKEDAGGAEGGEAPPASSSVPNAKLEHISEDIATSRVNIPAAEGGSTAGKTPVYDTPKLRASSDSAERGKELG